jgi:hypothetical protein
MRINSEFIFFFLKLLKERGRIITQSAHVRADIDVGL